MIPEAQLFYYKARVYDAVMGRFLQTDPVGYASDLNPYAYVGNDPVNWDDPSGMVSAQCLPPQCKHIDWPTGGYTYYNGTTTIYCSVGTFEDSTAASGDCSVVGSSNQLLNGGIWVGGSTPIGGGKDNGPLATTVQEIAVTAAKKFGQCVADQYGLGALGIGATAVGQPIPGTKPFVTPGSSRGTSVAGMAADSIFGKVRLPVRLPTIVGGWGTGTALRIAYTKSAARFAGRAVPILGEALLAYDAISISACFQSGD
jgi:hypothetical protein